MTTEALLQATPSELEAVRRRFNPYHWASSEARIKLPKSGYLDFDAHPFMRQVYADTHPDITVIKGAQLGFSTWAMCRAFWGLTTFPITVIYTFPNRDLVSDYTASRIDPIIVGTPFLNERIVDVNSVRLKKFSRSPRGVKDGPEGVSLIHFTGAAQEKDAIAVDADLLIHDEEDKSNPVVISAFPTRLDHSSYKWRVRLSTPTIPDFGVHLSYQGTDQHKWLVTCPFCNGEFELRWPDKPGDTRSNVEPHTWAEVEAGYTPRFKCHLCGHTLEAADRAAGRWVALNPSSPGGRGYQVSQMAAPWITAAGLLQAQAAAKFPHLFWNFKIGIAWQSGSVQMTREALMGRAVGPPRSRAGSGRFAGIDVGKDLHIVIEDYDDSGVPRIVAMEQVPWDPDNDFSEADEVLERHGVTVAVMDRQPETGMAERFAKRHNRPGINRVYLCTYREETVASRQAMVYTPPAQVFDRNAEVASVKTPRDSTITVVVDELLSKLVLPEFDGSPEYESFILHCRNTKKQPVVAEGESDEEGDIARYRWINTGPDHFFHAALYSYLARLAPRPLVPQIAGIISMKRSEKVKLTDYIAMQEAQANTDALPPRVRRQRMG